jgi:hypothetical protein
VLTVWEPRLRLKTKSQFAVSFAFLPVSRGRAVFSTFTAYAHSLFQLESPV